MYLTAHMSFPNYPGNVQEISAKHFLKHTLSGNFGFFLVILAIFAVSSLTLQRNFFHVLLCTEGNTTFENTKHSNQ